MEPQKAELIEAERGRTVTQGWERRNQEVMVKGTSSGGLKCSVVTTVKKTLLHL
jgi:hypothetical protein